MITPTCKAFTIFTTHIHLEGTCCCEVLAAYKRSIPSVTVIVPYIKSSRETWKGVWQSKQLVLTKTHPLTSARHERKQIPNYGPKIPIAHWDLILVCTHFPPSLRKSWLYILACSKAGDPTAHSNSEFPPQWPSGNSCWRSVSSPSLGQEGGMHNVHSSMTTIWKSSMEKHGKLTILEMHVCLEPHIRSPLLWLWMYNYMFLWCAVCWHIDKYHC